MENKKDEISIKKEWKYVEVIKMWKSEWILKN